MQKAYCIYLIVLVFIFSSCVKDLNPGNVLFEEKLEIGYKICLIGDTGTGLIDQYKVSQVMFKENCDQVRILGDIIYNFGLFHPKDDQLRTKFFLPFENFIESKIPIYIVLGNHDYASNPGAWLLISNYSDIINFPSFYYANLHEDICFFTLDTNANFINQSKWLSHLNKSGLLDQCKFKIAFGHHPHKSSGMHGDAFGALREFFKRNIVGDFDLYVSGHDHHLSDEGRIRKTRFLISGSGAKVRKLRKVPRVWGESELGYLTLSVNRIGEKFELIYRFKALTEDLDSKQLHRGIIELDKTIKTND